MSPWSISITIQCVNINRFQVWLIAGRLFGRRSNLKQYWVLAKKTAYGRTFFTKALRIWYSFSKYLFLKINMVSFPFSKIFLQILQKVTLWSQYIFWVKNCINEDIDLFPQLLRSTIFIRSRLEIGGKISLFYRCSWSMAVLGGFIIGQLMKLKLNYPRL